MPEIKLWIRTELSKNKKDKSFYQVVQTNLTKEIYKNKQLAFSQPEFNFFIFISQCNFFYYKVVGNISEHVNKELTRLL